MTPRSFRPHQKARPGPSTREMGRLLARCGLDLTPLQLERLWAYHGLLREHNPELNLTRIHNFAEMVVKLYADSILPGLLMRLPSPLLDLGTGPGMPGIPLKIVFPELDVILAESRRKRVQFLERVLETLDLGGTRIVAEKISPSFREPVGGVITRALEPISDTLERVSGCLVKGGTAVFMKGPNCDREIEEALKLCSSSYRLLDNRPYHIPSTAHQRRLVVFERTRETLWAMRHSAMEKHRLRKIESDQNEFFKSLKALLSGRGIRKSGQALLAGPKQVTEVLRDFPGRCLAWISPTAEAPPPPEAPEGLGWYQLEPRLFDSLDIFGTHSPLLLLRVDPLEEWNPLEGFPEGCSVLIPFQDPENVGAAIRSAVAFAATRVILLAESAHPYHPKSLRASGGAVLHACLRQGPSIRDLPMGLPIVTLSSCGRPLAETSFPESFGLLAGLEGPGLPEGLRQNACAIPIEARVESLNAAVSLAVALYEWSRRRTPGSRPSGPAALMQ